MAEQLHAFFLNREDLAHSTATWHLSYKWKSAVAPARWLYGDESEKDNEQRLFVKLLQKFIYATFGTHTAGTVSSSLLE